MFSREIIATREEEKKRVTVGRELRMIELKQEVNELCRRLGEPPLHGIDSPQGGGGTSDH
jgi:hypothetical protein